MKNRLDKFIKKKLTQRPYQFQDSYWQGMEQILDQNPLMKKRRRRGIWLLLFLLITSGSFGVYQIYNPSSKTLNNLKQYSENQYNTAIINDQIRLAGKSLLNRVNEDEIHSVPLKELVSILPSRSSDITAKQNNVSEFTLSLIQKNSFSNDPDLNIDSHFDVDAERIFPDLDSGIKAKEKTALIGEENGVSMAESNADLLNRCGALPIWSRSINIWNDISVPAMSFQPIHADFGTKVIRRNKFSYGFSGGINSNTELYGFKVGIALRFDIRPVLNIQSSISYNRMEGVSPITKRRQAVVYGFRSSSREAYLRANSFHFIEIPVTLNYKFYKHNFGAGIRIKYLAGIRGDVSEIDVENGNSVATKNWIVTDGFNRIIPSLGLLYGYDLTDRLSMNIHLDYGLNTLNNPTYEQENGIDLKINSKLWTGITFHYYLK